MVPNQRPLYLRTNALSSIFHHQQPIAIRYVHDGVHVAGHAGIVNREDRFSAWCNRTLDQSGVYVLRFWADVHEDGLGAAQNNGIGGGDKGEGGHNDLIARPQVA